MSGAVPNIGELVGKYSSGAYAAAGMVCAATGMNGDSTQDKMLSSHFVAVATRNFASVEDRVMPFINEYVPKLNEPASEFFASVRDKFKLGLVSTDKWTVDKAHDMVLVRTGRGHDHESENEEYFSFVTTAAHYRLHTKILSNVKESATHLRMTREIAFVVGEGLGGVPDEETLRAIKLALTAYMDYGVISRYESCDLTLQAASGRVI